MGVRSVLTAFILYLGLCTPASILAWTPEGEKALEAIELRDFEQAREMLIPLAHSGDARAAFELGKLYANGQGVERSFATARWYFERAADGGNTDAVTRLGMMYLRGDGVIVDLERARGFLQRAAAKGDTTAAALLADMDPAFESEVSPDLPSDVQEGVLNLESLAARIQTTTGDEVQDKAAAQPPAAPSAPRAAQPASSRGPSYGRWGENSRNFWKDNVILLMVCLVGYMGFVFHLAQKARVVVFDNDLDSAASFIALIFLPLFYAQYADGGFESPTLQGGIFLVVAIAAGIFSVFSCFRWNGSWWGAVVFPAKLLFCVLTIIDIVVIHTLLSDRKDSAGRRYGPSVGDVFTAFSIAAIAFGTMKVLTNGDRVRAHRAGPTGGGGAESHSRGADAGGASSGGSADTTSSRASRRERFRSADDSSSAQPEAESAASPDPLKVFNIEEGYSEEELKARYHELLRQYHPDKFHSLGEDFADVANRRVQEINRAYEELRSRL